MVVSEIFSRMSWLRHGFGTREMPLSQHGMASLTQIHSAISLIAKDSGGSVGEGDALMTKEAGLAVSVRSADCFPILLADPRKRAVAAIHAGWRGTAARIVPHTLERMTAEFGTAPDDVYAAIGPGIGACCYEVGEEVARQFGLDRAGRIDLAEANRGQLSEAGVLKERIEVLGLCTYCDPRRFHSYRRDKDAAGRMISYIGIVP